MEVVETEDSERPGISPETKRDIALNAAFIAAAVVLLLLAYAYVKDSPKDVTIGRLRAETVLDVAPEGVTSEGKSETCQKVSGFRQVTIDRRYGTALPVDDVIAAVRQGATNAGWTLATDTPNAAGTVRDITFERHQGRATLHLSLDLPLPEPEAQQWYEYHATLSGRSFHGCT